MCSIPDDLESITRHIRLSVLFLKQFSYLIEAYILDFFTESHWHKLPADWRRVLDGIEPQFLADWLNPKSKLLYSEVWPLGLQALRAAAFAYSLPRESSTQSSKFIEEFLLKHTPNHNADKTEINWQWKPAHEELSVKGGQHYQLKHLCRRHVKPKKQHEISRLAQVVSLFSSRLNLDQILDIGAGQGHLSRLLSFGYGLKVVTIEAKEEYVAGAQKMDLQALKDVYKNKKKQLSNDKGKIPFTSSFIDIESIHNIPQHNQLYISQSSSASDIIKILQNSEGTQNLESKELGIVGLHTCGSLACTLLRLFLGCPHAKALFSISCCYMKLNSDSKDYPMSQFVTDIAGHELSYEAREVACHAIEMYREKMRDHFSSLKIHCFRATLETLITRHYPKHRRLGLRSIKHSEKMSFPEYARKALSRVDICIPEHEFISADVENCLQQWKRVIVFYSLRLLLAPVIESIVLLDRILYLAENGVPACLIPLFDSALSPRNHILIVVKKSL